MPRKKLPCRYRVNVVGSKTLGPRYRVLSRDTGDHMGTYNSRREAQEMANYFDRLDRVWPE